MANFIVAVIASATIGAYQQRKAKQKAEAARRRALEAQREAAAIEARASNTNQPIPVIYGRAGTPGLAVYSQVGKIWQNNAPMNATDMRISGDSGFEIDTAEERNTVLLRQFVIAIAELKKVTYALIDGEPFDAGKFDNAQDIKWAFGDDSLVISGGMAAIGGEERKATDVRFTGLTFATAGFHLDLDDPKFTSFPELFFYCEGIDLSFLIRDSQGYAKQAPAQTVFPYEIRRSNPALVLYDYLTQHSDFGPNLPESRIDVESFAYAQSLCADRICHVSLIDSTSSLKYDPTVSAGAFDPLKNVFWSRAYPAARNAIAGTNYASYWNHIQTHTTINSAHQQCDGLLPDDEANRFDGINVTLNRFEFNGAVSTTRKFFDAVDLILATMPGAQFFRSVTGKWKLAVPNPLQSLSNIPIFDEFDDDFQEVRPDADDLANRITVRFSDIEKDYAGGVIEFPAPGSPLDQQLQAADGGVFRLSIDIVGCNNKYHAMAIAANELLIRRREAYRFTVPKRFMLYEQGDVIHLRRERLPALDVYAIITAKRPNPDLSITFTARRFSRADYDLYLTDQERIPIFAEVPQIPFVSYSTGTPTAPPPTVTAPVRQVPGAPGTPAVSLVLSDSITIGWDAPTTGGAIDTTLTTDYYEADISLTSDFAISITSTISQRTISFEGLSAETTYHIRVRARNVRGFGDYSTALEIATAAEETSTDPATVKHSGSTRNAD